MKRLAPFVLMLAAAPGCLHMPWNKAEPPPVTVVHHAPVLPEQVKETTAHKVAAALDEEVAIDETTPVPRPGAPTDNNSDKESSAPPR